MESQTKLVVVIIPAYLPAENLLQLVNELIDSDFGRIVIIDDGSTSDTRYIFDLLSRHAEVDILRHADRKSVV